MSRIVIKRLQHAGFAAVVVALAEWGIHVSTAVGGGLLLGSIALWRAWTIRGDRLSRSTTGSRSGAELERVREIVKQHGEDSLAPFIVRPDKSFEVAEGGVIAYRRIEETMVVSGDPVAPVVAVPRLVDRLISESREHGCELVMYGASSSHLDLYRRMGLRAVCVGEEAVVDPAGFSLEGRSVRKLRQSVHRIERRGWQITAIDGLNIDALLQQEIEAVEESWRSTHPRMLGFAMSMGEFDPGVGRDDLYLLARSPEGDLRAVMRFIMHCGKLSLDTMRRVGETPNGLNEALVCRCLAVARARNIPEVSLNYAGLAHLIRREPAGGRARQMVVGLVVRRLNRHFQMERLVCFNQKFSPEWRPRYLVYSSRAALPRSMFRVLQAEGYLPCRSSTRRQVRGVTEIRWVHKLLAGVLTNTDWRASR